MEASLDEPIRKSAADALRFAFSLLSLPSLKSSSKSLVACDDEQEEEEEEGGEEEGAADLLTRFAT
jgi:hypothetical protein